MLDHKLTTAFIPFQRVKKTTNIESVRKNLLAGDFKIICFVICAYKILTVLNDINTKAKIKK
jgi:hypothetical protein